MANDRAISTSNILILHRPCCERASHVDAIHSQDTLLQITKGRQAVRARPEGKARKTTTHQLWTHSTQNEAKGSTNSIHSKEAHNSKFRSRSMQWAATSARHCTEQTYWNSCIRWAACHAQGGQAIEQPAEIVQAALATKRMESVQSSLHTLYKVLRLPKECS